MNRIVICGEQRAEGEEKKGLTQMTQMTQIKKENRYGMNRILGILGILKLKFRRNDRY